MLNWCTNYYLTQQRIIDMKTKIYCTAALLFICYTANTSAQTNKKDSVVNRSVTVERDFQPVIQDAGKILTTPAEIEPDVEKTTPSYATFASPLSVSYSIHPLDPELLVHKQSDVLKGYFRVAAGYPGNTLADFMYPLVKNKSNRLDFSVNHLGAFGSKTHSKTNVGLQYDHLFNSFSVFTGIGITHDYFNYYAPWQGSEKSFIMSAAAASHDYDSKAAMYTAPDNSTLSLYDLSGLPQNETHWRVNTHVGIKSSPLSTSVKYLFDLQYNIFQSVKEQMDENHLKLVGKFEIPFNDNYLGMNIDINNLVYGVNNQTAFNFPETYSVIKFNPYYKLEGDAGFLKLGVKTGISANHGQVFTPSPDVEGEWNAIKRYLAVYGGVTGDLEINSMSHMYDVNRYLSSPYRLNDLYTPIDAYAGVKLKPTYNFIFDIFGNYKIINKQYFFVNREYKMQSPLAGMPTNINNTIYQNRFDTITSNATQRTLGARVDYSYKDMVNVYFKGAHHFWHVNGQQYAWQMPMWDVDFGASVKIMNDFGLNTQVFFQDGRYAKLGNNAVKMAPVLDVNLGGSYSYSNWLTLFVKANNLLNKKYDIYYGYQVQGINAMAGVILSF